MKFVELTEEQVEEIEERLEEYDQMHMPPAIEGSVQLGIEEDGRLVAGLDASITTFRILYVSTVFVEEEYRRKGVRKAPDQRHGSPGPGAGREHHPAGHLRLPGKRIL